MARRVTLIRHAQSAANAGLPSINPSSIALTEHGLLQAQVLATTFGSPPSLIISSPFERSIHTAQPTLERFREVSFEIWPVEEFTYLSPSRFVGTTQAERKTTADAYWEAGDKAAIDGPGAESFGQLLRRAQAMLDRLASIGAEHVLVFSHGQFIRAAAWLIKHGDAAGEPERMRQFRKLDVQDPLLNCACYQLTLLDGGWVVEHQVGQDGSVRFIDEFCSDQSFAPIPATLVTSDARDAMYNFKKLIGKV